MARNNRPIFSLPKSSLSLSIESIKQEYKDTHFSAIAPKPEKKDATTRLDTGKSLFFDHHAPEVVKMFMGWR